MSNHKDKNGQEFIRNISHYKDTERRSGKKRRSKPVGDSNLIPDDLKPDIKEFLTESLENQKRRNKIEQQKADVEARKTEAIESFLTFVTDFMEGFAPKNTMTEPATRRGPYKQKTLDDNRKKVFKIIAKMRERNEKYADIADYLEKEGIPTFSGRGEWHAQTIHRLCRDKAYKRFLAT